MLSTIFSGDDDSGTDSVDNDGRSPTLATDGDDNVGVCEEESVEVAQDVFPVRRLRWCVIVCEWLQRLATSHSVSSA